MEVLKVKYLPLQLNINRIVSLEIFVIRSFFNIELTCNILNINNKNCIYIYIHTDTHTPTKGYGLCSK